MARLKTRGDSDEGGGNDAMAAANARAAKEIEDAEKAEKESGDPSKEREVSIEEDEDDDEPSQPGANRQRRNQRSAHQQAREDAERRAEAAEAKAREFETRSLALAAIVNTPRGEQRAPEPSPVDQELERAFEDAERLNDEWDTLPQEKRANPDTLKEYRKRMRAIDIRKTELALKKQAAPSGPSPQQVIAEETLNSEFPELMSHPQGKGVIAAEFRALEAMGHKDSLATLKLAATAARTRLGLGTDHRRAARTPDDSLRAKLSGGTHRSHGGTEPRPATIRMSKADRDMAHSMYPSLSGADAEKRWAQRVGKKLVTSGERD